MSMTIEQIEGHPIHGNFHFDSDLWKEAESIVVDETKPLETRLRALKVIDRIIGEDSEVNEDSLNQFMTDHNN